MLISLNEAHFSIVAHREEMGSVLVRAKRAGDIEKYWPGANIMIDEGTGFLERAVIPRYQVAGVISEYILNKMEPDIYILKPYH